MHNGWPWNRLLSLAGALLILQQVKIGASFNWNKIQQQHQQSASRKFPLQQKQGTFVGSVPRYHCSTSTLAVVLASSEKEAVGGFSSDGDDEKNMREKQQIERFHQDMKRVLENRDNGGVAAMAQESTEERRQRPAVLEHDKDGVQRVLTMLDRLVEMGIATEETFHIAMKACLERGRLRWRSHATTTTSQSSSRDGTQVICAADQLEFLLEKLQGIVASTDISLETYLLVLEAYATCSTPRGGRNYAQKADDLISLMQERGVFGDGDGVENLTGGEVIPVPVLMHVLHAWAWQQANKERGDCAERANEYLEEIEQSTSQEKAEAELLLQCYDWVLEAWSKSGSRGSAEKADDVFCRMKKLNQTQADSIILSTATYANAILSWSKSKSPGSAQKAHDLLVEMLEHFEAGAFPTSEPELIAFNTVIAAWARIGRRDKAEEVLWMMDGARAKCNSLVSDVRTYNSVLHAYVIGPNKNDALTQIQRLAEFMETNCEEQPGICPDSFTYNTLMKVGNTVAWRVGSSIIPSSFLPARNLTTHGWLLFNRPGQEVAKPI